MATAFTTNQKGALAGACVPLTGLDQDYDGLIDLVGDAHLVLLGEASHGTHEFYSARCILTQRLIQEKKFTAVAVEADWPDAYRVNCYVQGQSRDDAANDALAGFKRFPSWMWRNTDVLEFVGWLRAYNDQMPGGAVGIGFYGLDLYSLYASMAEVLRYLETVDPAAAVRARVRYGCFEGFEEDSQLYGMATSTGVKEPCEDDVVRQLQELRRRAADYAGHGDMLAEDRYFYAEQNARLVKNAEEYYRTLFRGRVSSWNLRDRHMAETLAELLRHLNHSRGEGNKVVVWAHNSHLGDARATEMGRRGEWNLGQLARQSYPREVISMGFSTYSGEVTAADDWGKPARRRRVRAALEGSYEDLLHGVGAGMGRPDFWINLRDGGEDLEPLRRERLQRAIGVIYRPDSERWSHYHYADLPHQFDAILHFERTTAVEPLEADSRWTRGEPMSHEAPESYPFGI